MSTPASTAEPDYDVAQDDIAARMIDALDGASSLQLYQLKALIEGMLAEAGSTMALFNLGITYRMKGDLLEARACFEKALSAGDNSAALELAKLYVVSPKESETARNYLSLVLADDSLCEAEREEARGLLSRI